MFLSKKKTIYLRITVLMLAIFLFGRCQTSMTPTVGVVDTPIPMITPTLDIVPTVASTPKVLVNEPIVLRLWTIEEVSPKAKGGRGSFFERTISAFKRSHNKIDVEDVILKKSSGKGGMLDFLRTSKDVAPTVLPDIAIINAVDLQQAYSENLILPLEDHLDQTIIQDLLPVARRIGTIDDHLVGIPLSMSVAHLINRIGVFTENSVLWSDILTNNVKYIFPVRGVNGLVNDVTLSQYFSAGGTLLDDQGVPQIDQQALRDVLENYQKAIELGVIEPKTLQALTSGEELWQEYSEGRANVFWAEVNQYLANQELLEDTTFATGPIQSKKNLPVTVTYGRVFVLVTTNPQRQKAAVDLIEWFSSTANNANWNNVNQSIPTRDSAYQRLAEDSPYWEFLTELLNTAIPYPRFPGYDQVGRILQQAVQQVISGEATPKEATENAVDALAK
jgi:multiple sugar transport system substrate-binding protein